MIRKLPRLKATVKELDPRLGSVFIPWGIRNPRYLRAFMRLLHTYGEVKKLRGEAKERGLTVPPFMILSITSRCNLSCSGCFASACGTNSADQRPMSLAKWKGIISEACSLGVFGFVIAGGEPMTYPGMLDLCSEFRDRLFIIFTNGTAMDRRKHEKLRGLGNVVVFVSLEGGKRHTDLRRGQGVHEKAVQALRTMIHNGVLTGISVTITRDNYRFWMEEGNLDRYLSLGIKTAAFIEYIPTTKKGKDYSLMLDPDERKAFRERMLEYKETKPAYVMHSPGDEEWFGGCVSSGRGFVHVTPAGDLTPCPVTNVATHNLNKASLRDALAGRLFEEIRKNEHLLETEGTPCGLFAHSDELRKLAESIGAREGGR